MPCERELCYCQVDQLQADDVDDRGSSSNESAMPTTNTYDPATSSNDMYDPAAPLIQFLMPAQQGKDRSEDSRHQDTDKDNIPSRSAVLDLGKEVEEEQRSNYSTDWSDDSLFADRGIDRDSETEGQQGLSDIHPSSIPALPTLRDPPSPFLRPISARSQHSRSPSLHHQMWKDGPISQAAVDLVPPKRPDTPRPDSAASTASSIFNFGSRSPRPPTSTPSPRPQPIEPNVDPPPHLLLHASYLDRRGFTTESNPARNLPRLDTTRLHAVPEIGEGHNLSQTQRQLQQQAVLKILEAAAPSYTTRQLQPRPSDNHQDAGLDSKSTIPKESLPVVEQQVLADRLVHDHGSAAGLSLLQENDHDSVPKSANPPWAFPSARSADNSSPNQDSPASEFSDSSVDSNLSSGSDPERWTHAEPQYSIYDHPDPFNRTDEPLPASISLPSSVRPDPSDTQPIPPEDEDWSPKSHVPRSRLLDPATSADFKDKGRLGHAQNLTGLGSPGPLTLPVGATSSADSPRYPCDSLIQPTNQISGPPTQPVLNPSAFRKEIMKREPRARDSQDEPSYQRLGPTFPRPPPPSGIRLLSCPLPSTLDSPPVFDKRVSLPGHPNLDVAVLQHLTSSLKKAEHMTESACSPSMRPSKPSSQTAPAPLLSHSEVRPQETGISDRVPPQETGHVIQEIVDDRNARTAQSSTRKRKSDDLSEEAVGQYVNGLKEEMGGQAKRGRYDLRPRKAAKRHHGSKSAV